MHMGKPEQGSWEWEAASVDWKRMHAEKGATRDNLGKCKDNRYTKRVAVKVKDLIRISDREVRQRGFQKKGKEIKNASQDDLDKLEHQIQQNDLMKGSVASTFGDLAKSLAVARGSSADGDIDAVTTAFSADGNAMMSCPDLAVLQLIAQSAKSKRTNGQDDDEAWSVLSKASGFSTSTTHTTTQQTSIVGKANQQAKQKRDKLSTKQIKQNKTQHIQHPQNKNTTQKQNNTTTNKNKTHKKIKQKQKRSIAHGMATC